MKRMIRASRDAQSDRVDVSASMTIGDMIDAFQTKLDEVKVDSSSDIACIDEIDASREVDILPSDDLNMYEDKGAGFADAGEVVTLADLKDYWNRENETDLSLSYYDSFDDWLNDTLSNYILVAIDD